MEITHFGFTILVVLLIGIQEIRSTKDYQEIQQLDKKSNPLANLILNEDEIGDVSRTGDHTKDTLPRVKRQFYYDPYYRRRPVTVAIPVPIILTGFGNPGFGFGGRGFGGRGIGGFGGRGSGGFGGRGRG